MARKVCETCAFYEDDVCKRFPPVPIQEEVETEHFTEAGSTFTTSEKVVNVYYPPVEPENWCGEWKEWGRLIGE